MRRGFADLATGARGPATCGPATCGLGRPLFAPEHAQNPDGFYAVFSCYERDSVLVAPRLFLGDYCCFVQGASVFQSCAMIKSAACFSLSPAMSGQSSPTPTTILLNSSESSTNISGRLAIHSKSSSLFFLTSCTSLGAISLPSLISDSSLRHTLGKISTGIWRCMFISEDESIT